MNRENQNILSLSDFPLWTALITPFTPQGEVDYHALARLVDEQQQANNAILLLGSTGEGLALEQSEQQQIVEFVCELKPSVPLMVAVGGFNLQAQINWIKQCNQLPIQAFLLASPLYAKPGVIGQIQWFKTLLDAAEHPCMLYNVPSRSGVEIAPQVVSELADHENLWAMKEASGDINKFLAYRNANCELLMFSGEDAMMPYLASAGAKGLVSVCANAWPEATHLYVSKSLSGDKGQLFSVWQNAIESLFEVANPIPIKVLMHQQNMIECPNLRPPLTHDELRCHQALLTADQQVTDWLCHSRSAQL
jgi:4-hydroxy-tetrahydrodipicolinate synthase